MADLNACQPIVLSTVILLVIGITLAISGLGTVKWMEGNPPGDQHLTEYGLFESCHGDRPVLCSFYRFNTLPGWWEATRTFMMMAIICYLVPVCLASFYYCDVYKGHFPLTHEVMTKVNMGCYLGAASFMILSLLVFGIESRLDEIYEKYTLSVSYGITFIAAFIAIAQVVLHWLILRRSLAPNDWVKP